MRAGGHGAVGCCGEREKEREREEREREDRVERGS